MWFQDSIHQLGYHNLASKGPADLSAPADRTRAHSMRYDMSILTTGEYEPLGTRTKCLVWSTGDWNLNESWIRRAIKQPSSIPDTQCYKHQAAWQVYLMLGTKGLRMWSSRSAMWHHVVQFISTNKYDTQDKNSQPLSSSGSLFYS